MFVLIPVLLLVGALFYAVTWIESGAVARVEASNIAKAAEVQRQSLATSERLRADAEAASAQRHQEAQATIVAIRAAEADARAEAAAHAEASADAWALVDEMGDQVCPPPPKPDDPCSWLCTLPPLPE